MKLVYGAGRTEHPSSPEEVFFDIVPHHNIDVVGSVLDLPFEDNSFDEVYSHHVLEHLLLNELYEVVRGLYRILKPNGVFSARLPDLYMLCWWLVENGNNPDLNEQKKFIMNQIYHQNDSEYEWHKYGYLGQDLVNILSECGFQDCKFNRGGHEGKNPEFDMIMYHLDVEAIK